MTVTLCRCTPQADWARVAGPDLQDRPRRLGAEEAAHNFVASVFRDVGLPDVLVSDRDMRSSAFWTGLRAALGASLIYGSSIIITQSAR